MQTSLALSFYRKNTFTRRNIQDLLSIHHISSTLSSRLDSQVRLQSSSDTRPTEYPHLVFVRLVIPGIPRTSSIPFKFSESSTGPGTGDLHVNGPCCPLWGFHSPSVSSPAPKVPPSAAWLPSIQTSAGHVFRAHRATGHRSGAIFYIPVNTENSSSSSLSSRTQYRW